MKTIHLKRPAVLAGLVGVAMGAALLVPAAASAQVPSPPVGQFAGGLTFNQSSGNGNETPTFTAAHACPGTTAQASIVVIDSGGNEQFASNPIAGPVSAIAGFTGSLSFPMSLMPSIATGTVPGSFEFVVDCQATAGTLGGPNALTDYTIVDYAADGSWSVAGAGPTATTTSLTVNGSTSPAPVAPNSNVTLNATVAPAAATGSVQFKDNGANLGSPVTVTGGTANTSTTSLAAGTHSITAVFSGTGGFGGSTSGAVSITVTNASVQTASETINVNVPQSEGVFTMTVGQTSVQLSQAVLDASNTFFESTGSIGTVTVSDGRNQSVPGWHITGAVSDFTGPQTIGGNSLGWSPSIQTPNAANDVVAGSPVAAGSNPGLKQGSGLASAAASKGLGTTVLTAGLDLKVPSSTKAGAYQATLTITGFDAP